MDNILILNHIIPYIPYIISQFFLGFSMETTQLLGSISCPEPFEPAMGPATGPATSGAWAPRVFQRRDQRGNSAMGKKSMRSGIESDIIFRYLWNIDIII